MSAIAVRLWRLGGEDESDLGSPVGCLYIPSSHGRTIAGTVVRVSAMRPTSGRLANSMPRTCVLA
jgi:hypothetical protein